MTTYLQSAFNFILRVPRVLRQALPVLFLGFALSGVALSAEQATNDEYELNFTDTDINAVITAVAKLTGKNFIIDPRVKGKVTVITHKSMSKDEVYEVFQSMLKVHGFAAVPGKSSIKIVPEVNAKQDTIRTLTRRDVTDGDELVTKVIQIKHVTAAQLVPILRPLVPQRGHLAAYPQSNVLIISDSAGNIARLSTIIRRIDQAVNQEIEILTLEHAVASDIVRVINQLHRGAKDKPTFTIVADDRTNSVLLGGDRGERLRLRAIITHMDVPLELAGNTQVVYLRYANATDLVKVLTDVSKTVVKGPGGKSAAAASTTSSDINIHADENTNALIINAPPGVMRTLRAVINRLDIRREQVHLEAVLAEVSYNKASELGVQWAFDGSDGGNKTGPIGVLNFSSFAPPGIAGLLEDPPLIGEGLNLGLGKIENGDLTLGVLVRALAADGNTNILATPSVVTLDNEEASIVVGQNVPFVTGQYTNTGGGTTPANPFQTIDRQDVGITLKITPQINEGNTIKMEILQEISSLTAATIGVDLITNKRQITTNVMVEDNQVLVLGGLIDDQLRESEAKIPGLGDIPILGWLFKYKKAEKVKQNLMVFIHPTILRNEAQQSRITGEKYNYIRQKQIEDREQGMLLFKDTELPIMREFTAVTPLPPRYTPMSGTTTGQDAPPINLLNP
jgi:general secretion pathway protein D